MRDKIIEQLRYEIIGPGRDSSDEKKAEILIESPLIEYISGILEPRTPNRDISDEVLIDDDSTVDVTSKVLNESSVDEGLSASNTSQSSLGLSFIIPKKNKTNYSIQLHYGTYEKFKTKEEYISYRRIDNHFTYELETNVIEETSTPIYIDVTDNDGEPIQLCVVITNRTRESGHIDLTDKLLLTLSVFNKNEWENRKRPPFDLCFFQVELGIKAMAGPARFLPYPEPIVFESWDNKLNALLFRNVNTYGVGHCCSLEWENEDECNSLFTTFLPEYEIHLLKHTVSNEIDLKMSRLSDIEWDDSSYEILYGIKNEYDDWIGELRNKLGSFNNVIFEEQAQSNIKECVKCSKRIVDGIELLKSDDKAKEAFKLMNRVMLEQQLRYSLETRYWNRDETTGDLTIEENIIPDINDRTTWSDWDGKQNTKYGRWRIFQMAFILINLKGMVDGNDHERKFIELLWFPTGGGKTEAYLGLSAFSILYNRLMGRQERSVDVIMRYTLRLLTAQQFNRASSMILSCDLLRREMPESLGNEEISIGMFVGTSVTPNSRQDAIYELNQLEENHDPKNFVFVVLKCPCCGKQLGLVDGNSELRGLEESDNTVKFKCYGACPYSNQYMPIYVIDDDVYENRPSLVIGTVDKFALIPFQVEMRHLFGVDTPVRGQRSPPSLIIQDELHLISGPLGSMVGHYEGIFHKLMEQEDNLPKIIASTATISMAREQINTLYAADPKDIMIFPPPGIDHDDSFFAKMDRTPGTGRKYVGLFANSSPSFSTSQVRIYSILLQSAKLFDDISDKVRDAYHTLLCYFSSLKELGHARTILTDDVATGRLQQLHKKLEITADQKRYLNTNKIIELTSRIPNYDIPNVMRLLDGTIIDDKAIDACLATNMISVGLDVQRLGIMCCVTQPKSTAEYIQATSRIGRDKSRPGVVFTIYNTARARDMSHFERFISYHSKIYTHVEPMSLTPFSIRVRERALAATFIAYLRNHINLVADRYSPSEVLNNTDLIEEFKDYIKARLRIIDESEVSRALVEIDEIIRNWQQLNPNIFGDFKVNPAAAPPLMIPFGKDMPENWVSKPFRIPSSMRNVDKESPIRIYEE